MTVQIADPPVTEPQEAEPTAFVSYRRSDSPSAAGRLAAAFKDSFGADRVFFDVDDLQLGSSWPEELQARVGRANVLLAVIGPRWVGLADEHGRRTVVDPDEEDVLRSELDCALRARSLIIPVLVDGATMPPAQRLPRAFRPLARLECATVHHDSWDRDVEDLIGLVRRRVREPRPAPAEAPVVRRRFVRADDPVPGIPDPEHFMDLVEYLENGDLLLPVVGSSLHEGVPPAEGSHLVPDRDELAKALSHRFRLDCEPAELARVAQHITSIRISDGDLHRALVELTGGDDDEPAPTHRFFARLPALLRARGAEHYQMIVTTNYDSSLERAFDQAGEPYDLAVFVADEGKFMHIPWWDAGGEGAVMIEVPNEYGGFPIDEYGAVERTVIVKIHGGVLHDAPRELKRRYKHNFVVTEDDYISFLSRNPVENLIPVQLLDKLCESHFLFLGYGVRDWSLRVFLRRIWNKGLHGWAIQRNFDRVDRGFWERLDVERLDVPLPAYLRELERHLEP
jgi:hypothetical protein